MDFGQILDSKSYDQVCKYASMPVCQYARMQVYTCLYKKLNKKKERARPYPRLQDFFLLFGHIVDPRTLPCYARPVLKINVYVQK